MIKKDRFLKNCLIALAAAGIFLFFGFLMPEMKEKTQAFLELLFGFATLFSIAVSEVNCAILCNSFARKLGIVSIITGVAGVIMYTLYLYCNYGAKHPHISAIGFDVFTIACMLQILFLTKKLREKNDDS